MSGQPAASGAAQPRVLLLADGNAHDVFEVLDVTDGIARVRSAFLFEIGEELKLRVESGGTTTETSARVRAHVGEDKITELELVDPPPAA